MRGSHCKDLLENEGHSYGSENVRCMQTLVKCCGRRLKPAKANDYAPSVFNALSIGLTAAKIDISLIWAVGSGNETNTVYDVPCSPSPPFTLLVWNGDVVALVVHVHKGPRREIAQGQNWVTSTEPQLLTYIEF